MNQTKAFPVGGTRPTPSTRQATRALASLVSIDQLSLAAHVKTSSWRDPVRRLQRPGPDAMPQRPGLDDDAMRRATLAALRGIEARMARADPWELRRAMDELHQLEGTLRDGDTLDYAQCLLIKLRALLDEQLVPDAAPGARNDGPRPHH
jgi:hypothetical protein